MAEISRQRWIDLRSIWSEVPAAQGAASSERMERYLITALIAGAAIVVALLFAVNRHYYHDDALITLRYARHFIEGKGIVWNLGETVEGYTNFLHLLVVSALGRLGVDLILATRIVSAGAYAAIAAMFFAYFRGSARRGTHRSAVIAAILTLTAAPLVIWVMGGLETPLFAALLLASTLLIVRAIDTGIGGGRLAAAGALFALAAMTRIDAVIILAAAAFGLIVSRAGSDRLKSVAQLSAGFGLLFGPYFLWRIWYYGDLLPNTFYAKATGDGLDRIQFGLAYLSIYFTSPPFLGPAVMIAAILAVRRGLWDASSAFLALAAALYLGYVVAVGGDHMPLFRFILPVIPILALLFERLTREPLARLPFRGFAMIAIAVSALTWLQIGTRALRAPWVDPAAYIGGIIGRYIDAHWPDGALVALNTAGSTPYYAPRLSFIDMLGLNDRHIAHRDVTGLGDTGLRWMKVPGHKKGDGAYVLARKPDYIIVGPAEGTPLDEPWFLSDLEMGRMREDLEAHYVMDVVPVDVRDEPGRDYYRATSSGTLRFTYYRRRTEPATIPGPR